HYKNKCTNAPKQPRLPNRGGRPRNPKTVPIGSQKRKNHVQGPQSTPSTSEPVGLGGSVGGGTTGGSPGFVVGSQAGSNMSDGLGNLSQPTSLGSSYIPAQSQGVLSQVEMASVKGKKTYLPTRPPRTKIVTLVKNIQEVIRRSQRNMERELANPLQISHQRHQQSLLTFVNLNKLEEMQH
ncbi:hypothetical protein V2J09_017368, partial [Rumex salicifolius]